MTDQCRYGDCTREPAVSVLFTPVNTELSYCREHAAVARRYFNQSHDETDLATSPRSKSLEELEGETQLVACDCETETFFAMRIGDDLELRCTDCGALHRPLTGLRALAATEGVEADD